MSRNIIRDLLIRAIRRSSYRPGLDGALYIRPHLGLRMFRGM